VGRERAKERTNENERRDISRRGEQEENVCTTRRLPRQLLRAASKSSGRVSALAALPCPTMFVTTDTDRQTPLLLLYIGYIKL